MTKTAKSKKTKQLTIRIPEELHLKLKVRAAEKGSAIVAIIENLIQGYLDEKRK